MTSHPLNIYIYVCVCVSVCKCVCMCVRERERQVLRERERKRQHVDECTLRIAKREKEKPIHEQSHSHVRLYIKGYILKYCLGALR